MASRRHLLFAGLYMLLLAVVGCSVNNQQKANQGASEIRQGLYKPTDAILLDEIEQTDALIYGRRCKGVVIRLAYGINRPFAEVMEEYHQSLLASNWYLSPSYEPAKTDKVAFYRKSSEVDLQINSILATEAQKLLNNNNQDFQTFYEITVIYTLPSNDDCIG